MDPSNYPGWSLADLLFPPGCIVLYDTEERFNGRVFLYWDMDGRPQRATTNELAADLQARLEEV